MRTLVHHGNREGRRVVKVGLEGHVCPRAGKVTRGDGCALTARPRPLTLSPAMVFLRMLIVAMSSYGEREEQSGVTRRGQSVTPHAHTRDKKAKQEKASCKDKTHRVVEPLIGREHATLRHCESSGASLREGAQSPAYCKEQGKTTRQSPARASRCTICPSPARQRVDQALAAGASVRDIAREEGLSKSVVGRHRDHRLGRAVSHLPTCISGTAAPCSQ